MDKRLENQIKLAELHILEEQWSRRYSCPCIIETMYCKHVAIQNPINHIHIYVYNNI